MVATFSFRLILNSIKLSFIFFRFIIASLLSFIVDIILFAVVYRLTQQLLTAMIVARVLSGAFNFYLNKYRVYRSLERSLLLTEAWRYLLLALLMFITSYFAITGLERHYQMNVIIARIIVDTLLFLANFVVQRYLFLAGTLRSLIKRR